MVNSIDILERAACYATGIDREMLHGRSRQHRIVFTRFLIAVAAIDKLGMNYTEAGKIVGIERSAVYNAKKVINSINDFGTDEDVLWWRTFDAMVGDVE